MTPEVARRLVDLNGAFYERFASSFAESRAAPQPGHHRLLPLVPKGARVLDVGCADGRFGRFLRDGGLEVAYTGVDFSAALLARAAATVPGDFLTRNLSLPGSLAGLGQYDLVVCLSTVQHIPGRVNRARLVAEMAERLAEGGRLVLANWQIGDSPRHLKKARPWSDVGLAETDVEPGDYLLTWERGGYGLRYVAWIEAGNVEQLAAGANLRVIGQFRSDGREGNLNLYSVLAS